MPHTGKPFPRTTWKDTGLTPVQVVVHKGRGIIEVCLNVGHLYPRIVTTTVIIFSILVVAGVFGYTRREKDNRSLTGVELDYANRAYSSIRTAQDLSEDFTPGHSRLKAADSANYDLRMMVSHMSSPKGEMAGEIFSDYLVAVKLIPIKDFECSSLKLKAHEAENNLADGTISNEDLTSSEVSLFRCEDDRRAILRTMNACQQEAFTLVTGVHPPPVSTCIYSHGLPTNYK